MANIIIYSTPSCPWCHRAMDYLKEKSIEFTHYDVSVDQEKAKEMIDKSGQRGVPVIDIDGTIIVGFDQTKVDELLGL